MKDLEAAALLPLGLAELALGRLDAARAALERSRTGVKMSEDRLYVL